MTLDFDYNFHDFEDGKGPNNSQFDVEIYDGTSWVNILTDNNDAPTCNWWDAWNAGANCLTDFNINVDTYNNPDFQVRFIYTDGGTGSWTGMIAIDNVVVSATTFNGGGGCTNFVDYYPDNDGDGFGDGNQSPTTICQGDTPPTDQVPNNTDCDDNNPNDVNLTFNTNPVPAGLHQANNSITSEGFVPNTGAAPGFITFQAGETIFLNTGFVAEVGADFTAKIEPCTSSPSPLTQQLDEELFKTSESSKEAITTSKVKTELTVYPNPTRDRTFVEFDATEAEQVLSLIHI